MGVTESNFNNTWNKTESLCLVALAAAEINQEQNRLVISVSQGIGEHDHPGVYQREIENAFKSAKYANGIYPGTVWCVTYHIVDVLFSPDKLEARFSEIQRGKSMAVELGLRIGARVLLYDGMKTARQLTVEFLQDLDFLIFNMPEKPEDIRTGPVEFARRMSVLYTEVIRHFRKVSPHLEVIIGGSGWPSAGKSSVGSDHLNTIPNQYTYWKEMAIFVVKNKFKVHMLEAFDQPGNLDMYLNTLRHYGWWRRIDNNITSYSEKVFEPDKTNSTSSSPKFEPKATSTGVIVYTTVPIILVGILLTGFLVYKLRSTKKTVEGLTEADIKEFIEGSTDTKINDNVENYGEEDTYKLPYNKDYEMAKGKLQLDKTALLGKGQFGIVFKGTLESTPGIFETVAVKTTKPPTSAKQLKNMLVELKLLIYLGQHPSIVRFIGASTTELRNGEVLLVVELCEKGSLENILRKKSIFVDQTCDDKKPITPNSYVNVEDRNAVSTKEPVTLKQMNAWILQIVQGMKYLGSKKIIHGDLATRNVLVASDNTIRITDFGLSRQLYEYTQYVKQSQEPLPWRWMAVESLRSLQFSTKSDVWSFGVTAWEIYSMASIPYAGLSWEITFVKKLERGLRLPKPIRGTTTAYEKMLECWHPVPSERPTFDQVEKFFSNASTARVEYQNVDPK